MAGVQLALSMTGLLPSLETVRWRHRTLRVNEQVRITVIETQTVDQPKVLQKTPRDAKKYEKAYVRRMAKEFGWTIQTSVRKTNP